MSDEDGVLDPEVLSDPVEDDGDAPQAAPVPPVEPAAGNERALATVDPFRRYLAEVRRYPALTREEEQDLARRYRESGDRDALFGLVTSNLMLVVRIALSFRRAARNLLDLVQEGNIGLLQAIERFDPELNVRLPTYAGWWIRAYMVKFLMDNVRLVRVGTTNARRKLLRNLAQERDRLEAMGFEVGPRELAEHFDVTETDVRDVQQALSSRDLSLDAPVGEEEQRSRHDVFETPGAASVEEEVARRELQQNAENAIGAFREGLSEREQTILDERILAEEPWTLQQLGDRFGITREAARQAEARLMKRLREHITRELGDAPTGNPESK